MHTWASMGPICLPGHLPSVTRGLMSNQAAPVSAASARLSRLLPVPSRPKNMRRAGPILQQPFLLKWPLKGRCVGSKCSSYRHMLQVPKQGRLCRVGNRQAAASAVLCTLP